MSTDRSIRILAVLPHDENVAQLEPFLSRSSMQVVRAESGHEAIAHASDERFDVTLAHLPLPDMQMQKLVENLRLVENPQRTMPLILMGHEADLEPGTLSAAPQVRKVRLDNDGDELRHAISEALGVAARLAVRIPIRLDVGIESGRTFRYCETRNLSRTGMLISAPQRLPVGLEFSFELILPYSYVSLRGLAEVVRHTGTSEETAGFGARFLDLAKVDSVRLESFIRSRLPRPPMKPLPPREPDDVSSPGGHS